MAKVDVRWKRRIIHNKITAIVSHGALKTKDVYKWIAELLGKPLEDIHISDLEYDKLDEVAQHCDRMIEKINAMNGGVTA
jgi:4-hydroxyphenylpyruvate dioxygenase-like putative hemolysin